METVGIQPTTKSLQGILARLVHVPPKSTHRDSNPDYTLIRSAFYQLNYESLFDANISPVLASMLS